MLEIKCPACGGTMRLEEGRLLRACPYCGAELSRAKPPRAGREIPGPSELEKKLAEAKITRRRSISSFSPRWKEYPNDFGANRALLYHGRLHEDCITRRGIDYSVVKCYLFNVFESPEKYTDAELDAKYAELLEGEQLKKVLSLCGDADVFFRDYIRCLAAQYVDLFIRGESRNSTVMFGFRRSLDSTAAETVRGAGTVNAAHNRAKRAAERPRGDARAASLIRAGGIRRAVPRQKRKPGIRNACPAQNRCKLLGNQKTVLRRFSFWRLRC